jgi:hypothetical protein
MLAVITKDLHEENINILAVITELYLKFKISWLDPWDYYLLYIEFSHISLHII